MWPNLLLGLAAAAPHASALQCELTVGFGSFATGIDRRAASRVERLVASEPAVTEVTRLSVGPEGEYALCVELRSRDSARRLFHSLKDALAEPVGAPVSVEWPEGGFEAAVRRQQK